MRLTEVLAPLWIALLMANIPVASANVRPVVADEATRQASGSIPPIEPSSTPIQVVNNLLVVDATTSRVLRYDDKGACGTDVRLLGVQPSTVGFTLHNPKGYAVFLDQASTSTGSVEFWSINLTAEPWLVTLNRTALGEVYVTSFQGRYTACNAPPSPPLGFVRFSWFDLLGYHTRLGYRNQCWEPPCATIPESMQECGDTLDNDRDGKIDYGNDPGCSSPSDNDEQDPPNPPHPPACRGLYEFKLIEQKHLFAPVFIAHSPHEGSGRIAGGSMNSRSSFIAPFGWSSQDESAASVTSNNGNTVGLFRHGLWGLYEAFDRSCNQKTGLTTRMIEPYWDFETFDLVGRDNRTDGDDVTTLGDSVTWDQRFRGPEMRITNHADTTLTFEQVSKKTTRYGGFVDFAAGRVSFSAIEHESIEEKNAYQEYVIRRGSYAVDWLWGDEQTWAFCRADVLPCSGGGQ